MISTRTQAFVSQTQSQQNEEIQSSPATHKLDQGVQYHIESKDRQAAIECVYCSVQWSGKEYFFSRLGTFRFILRAYHNLQLTAKISSF